MGFVTKILTGSGFTKVSLPSSSSLNHKIRLYSFPDQIPEKISHIQTALQKEVDKGRIYEGMMSQLDQEVQTKPYLLKTGQVFQLVTQEYALTLKEKLNYLNESTDHISKKSHERVECYTKKLEISHELRAVEEEGKIHAKLGNIYDTSGEHNKALEHYRRALEIALEFQDLGEKEKAYANLGDFYTALENFSEAVVYYEQELKVAALLKDQVKEAKCYAKLGGTYIFLREYRIAVEHYEKELAIAIELQDLKYQGTVYCKLGIAYYDSGEYHRAIGNHKGELEIAIKLQDREGEGKAYGNLGITYCDLGEYHQAIDAHNKELEIAIKLQNLEWKGKAYGNLGNAYDGLGDYHQAVKYHKKDLKIARELQDKVGEGIILGNLGNVYEALGEHHKAIEHHKKYLDIALELKDKVGQKRAYGNLGNAHSSLREYLKAVDYHNQCLEIAIELKDLMGEEMAYANLGSAYRFLGKYSEAVDYHTKSLRIAQKLGDISGEGRAYGNLGNVFRFLGEYHQAVEFQKKHLAVAEKLKDKVSKGTAYCNLGNAYVFLKEYSLAKECFLKSAQISHTLQQDAKEAQWQVTLFEKWSTPYIALEKMLLSQNKNFEALEISDARRARVLTTLISKKLFLKEPQTVDEAFFTVKEMQALAQKLQTTFVIYSLTPFQEKEKYIQVWIISPEGTAPPSIHLSSLPEEFSQLDKIFKAHPYKTERPIKEKKTPHDVFNEKLSSWYDSLIKPLEPYLPPQEMGNTITFIPDGFLAHLPFGAFYHIEKKEHLIEKYPVSMAPSIQVLSLLHQLPQPSSHKALLIGNPTTQRKGVKPLEYAEKEVSCIAELGNISPDQIFIRKEATVDNFLKYACQVLYIHLACHGVAGQKPQKIIDALENAFHEKGMNVPDLHSVFEGVCLLASEEEHPLAGHLHAKEIALMTLLIDLVFMSACHLGIGNLQKEGSIGPIWSFLGSGVRSTIAGYWPLPDTETTVQMVETFYTHYLGIKTPKLSKAKALQQAILVGMKKDRSDIRQWGSFFLSGLMN